MARHPRLWTLAVTLLFAGTATADGTKDAVCAGCCALEVCASMLTSATTKTCKVTSLADLGDAALADWVAKTIPSVVAPGTWNGTAGQAPISYYAPARILVVHHTAAVHTEVEAFIK